jgi:hypothetical protein
MLYPDTTGNKPIDKRLYYPDTTGIIGAYREEQTTHATPVLTDTLRIEK